MKRVMVVIAAAFLSCTASDSWAAGFRLPEQDSAALGMASAFVGQADNPSAVWYNPAGLTALDGTQVSGGITGVYPVLTHENNTVNPGTTEVSHREVHLPLHLYTTTKLNSKAAFGFGINNPFGLQTSWNANTSSTRYVSTFSKVISFNFNPNMAYQLNDSLSVAVGIDYHRLQATLEKTIFVVHPVFGPLGDHNFRLSGDGDGWGANAALKYAVSPALNAGISYRSRIKVELDGTADLTGGPAATSASGATSITLPDIIQAGISFKASEKLTVNTDVEYTLWSTYDRVVVTSNDAMFNATEEKQWNSVWCLRIGGQYKFSDRWKLRAGYLYDKNPVEEEYFDSRTPDSDRQAVSIGTGYASGKITVDAAYMYLRFKDRTISSSAADNDMNPFTPEDSLNGTYKSEAHLAGITVAYKF